MSAEQWISFQQAVKIVRVRLNASIGRAEAVVRAARASGEVRSRPNRDADVVLLTADDGIVGMSLRPGAKHRMEEFTTVVPLSSRSDLLDWLDRQGPQPKPKPAETKRPQDKRQRARLAIKARWPNGAPDRTALPNKLFCAEVNKQLKADCEKLGIAHTDADSTTILRAAGRRG
jgi:hypothetical protein